jgi:hypothetical protein
MSDVTYTLQLPEARLESIDRDADSITLHFSQVYLVQDMENAFEDSLWTQAVNLTIKEVSIDGDLPGCPCDISGGDITNNIYTYRDHAPLPINWRGEVRCSLKIAGSDAVFSISGSSMQLEQIETPRYIRHLKK